MICMYIIIIKCNQDSRSFVTHLFGIYCGVDRFFFLCHQQRCGVGGCHEANQLMVAIAATPLRISQNGIELDCLKFWMQNCPQTYCSDGIQFWEKPAKCVIGILAIEVNNQWEYFFSLFVNGYSAHTPLGFCSKNMFLIEMPYGRAVWSQIMLLILLWFGWWDE